MSDTSTLVDQVVCRCLVDDPVQIRELDSLRFPDQILDEGLTVSWNSSRLTFETRLNIPRWLGCSGVNFPAVAVAGIEDVDVEKVDRLVRRATGVDLPSVADQAVAQIAYHIDMHVGDVREVIRGMAAIDRMRSRSPTLWSDDDPDFANVKADYTAIEWRIRNTTDDHGRKRRRGGVGVGAYNKANELRTNGHAYEAEQAAGILRLTMTAYGVDAVRRLTAPGTNRVPTLRAMLDPDRYAYAMGRTAHQLRLDHDAKQMPADFAGRLRRVAEVIDDAKLAAKSRPILRDTWLLASAGLANSEIGRRTGRGDDVYRDLRRLRELGIPPDGSEDASRPAAVASLRSHLAGFLTAYATGTPPIRDEDLVLSPYLDSTDVRRIRAAMRKAARTKNLGLGAVPSTGDVGGSSSRFADDAVERPSRHGARQIHKAVSRRHFREGHEVHQVDAESVGEQDERRQRRPKTPVLDSA
jgi:hypothetical protein